MIDDLQLNDTGTSIELAVTEKQTNGVVYPVDITSATTLTVRFQKPDTSKTIVDKTGTIATTGANGNGADGIVQYITQTGDIDTVGEWKAQVLIDFANGSHFSSTITTFRVMKNIS